VAVSSWTRSGGIRMRRVQTTVEFFVLTYSPGVRHQRLNTREIANSIVPLCTRGRTSGVLNMGRGWTKDKLVGGSAVRSLSLCPTMIAFATMFTMWRGNRSRDMLSGLISSQITVYKYLLYIRCWLPILYLHSGYSNRRFHPRARPKSSVPW